MKTSPRLASTTGTAPGAPAARASSVETPATGTPRASASPRAVASPIRTPVKLPGPTPTASPSSSRVCEPAWRSKASTSSSTVTARDMRSPSTSPSETRALVATSVAVSKAWISIAANRDKPLPFFVAVLEAHLEPRRRKNSGPCLRPLDEDHCVVEVGLQISPLRCGNAAETEEIEMRHIDAALVPVADRVGRTRDRSLDAERTACAPDERRLPRTELSGDGHDVAGTEVGREPRRDLFRLCRRARLDQNRPSCTAGSATAGAT